MWADAVAADPKKLAAWQKFCTWATPVHQWAKMFIPHWMKINFSPVHSHMMQFFVDCWTGKMPEGKRRGVKVMMRSGAKSTCGRAAALYMMTEGVASGLYTPRQHQDYDMLYITGADELALQSMLPIWNELQSNKAIIAQYGRLLTTKPRENLDARLNNGFWIKGGGKNARWLGNHPQMLFCDDLEDRENISTDETRAKFRALWSETLNPMMLPGTYAVILGNYLSLTCWLRQIAHDPESHTSISSALEPDEHGNLQSIWPEKYSTEYLLEQMELKPYEFSTLFMNKPMARSESPVGIDDIKYYDESQLPADWWRGMAIVSMTDPAIAQTEKSCETAIVTLCGDHETERSEIYVLDVRAGHWKDTETLSQNYMIFDKYQPDHQGIEDATFQRMFVTMSNLTQDKPMGFNLRAHNCLTHGRKKKHRLQKASTHIKNVRFKRGDAMQDRLVDQLIMFSDRDKFDIGDGFCMALNEFMALYPPGYTGKSITYEPMRDITGRIIGYEPPKQAVRARAG
jgi:hypothetical protein